jgi:hypothetical protein
MSFGSYIFRQNLLGGSVFTPRHIADIITWQDAGFGVTDIGGKASAWKDRSLVGNDLVQATEPNRPTIVPNWRNGQPSLLGGGGVRISRTSLVGGAVAQPLTIYQVFDWAALAASAKSLAGTGSLSTRRQSSLVALNAGSANATSGIAVPAGGTPTIRRDFINDDDSEVRIEPDGAAASVSSTWSAPPGTSDWDGIHILAESNGANAWADDFAELIIYSRQLTAAEDLTVFAYLSNKYDIVHT